VALEEWSKLWQLTKMFVLHLGNNNPCYLYSMGGVQLQVVEEHKDLGILNGQGFGIS